MDPLTSKQLSLARKRPFWFLRPSPNKVSVRPLSLMMLHLLTVWLTLGSNRFYVIVTGQALASVDHALAAWTHAPHGKDPLKRRTGRAGRRGPSARQQGLSPARP